MAKRINGIPQCPNCGRRQNRVVLTCDAINGQFDTIRRRHCQNCNHRWYTGQVREVVLDAVEWTDNGKLVNMAWAR